MAGRRKKDKQIPGLELKVTVTPVIYGKPVEGLTPLEVTWPVTWATDWHEGHQDLGVRILMRDTVARVRRYLNGEGK